MPVWADKSRWRAKGAALTILSGGVIATLVVLTGGAQPEADMVTLTADVPQTVCFDPADPGMPDLLAARRLPVLAVYAYEPVVGAAGQVLVTLVGTDQSTRIGFFPDGAFAAESTADARRFFLPHAPGIAAENYCYDLTLLGGERSTARVELELSDALKN